MRLLLAPLRRGAGEEATYSRPPDDRARSSHVQGRSSPRAVRNLRTAKVKVRQSLPGKDKTSQGQAGRRSGAAVPSCEGRLRRNRRTPPGGRALPRRPLADRHRALSLESPPVIEREQVLHVARLARLRLAEEEVERMAGELSGILEHVDRIAELDLEDVEPTSHVVAARERPAPRRAAAELAAGDVARARRPTPPTAPSAFPRRRPRTDARAAGADGRRGRRPRSPPASFRARSTSRPGAAPPPATSSTPTSGALEDAAAYEVDRRPSGAASPRSRSRTSSAPRASPTTAGSRILEGYRPPYTATAVRRLDRRRRPRPRQDQHGRVRDGLLERELGLRAGPQPLGPDPGSRAAPPAARPRPSPAASRPARSGPTPAARSASRPRSAGSSA